MEGLWKVRGGKPRWRTVATEWSGTAVLGASGNVSVFFILFFPPSHKRPLATKIPKLKEMTSGLRAHVPAVPIDPSALFFEIQYFFSRFFLLKWEFPRTQSQGSLHDLQPGPDSLPVLYTRLQSWCECVCPAVGIVFNGLEETCGDNRLFFLIQAPERGLFPRQAAISWVTRRKTTKYRCELRNEGGYLTT